MGKVKNWAYDEAEKQIDKICIAYRDDIITKEEAINSLLKVEHSYIYLGDEMSYDIASEILDEMKGGFYA
jgi:glucosamine 6-phosphate synthetase-like amidotransferase/phosphosugar isomerase protein